MYAADRDLHTDDEDAPDREPGSGERYHGVRLADLDAEAPLIYAWAELPVERRSAFCRAIASGADRSVNAGMIPLSELGPEARSRLLDLLRAENGGWAHPRLSEPDGRIWLLGCGSLFVSAAATVAMAPAEAGSPTYRVTLRWRFTNDALDNAPADVVSFVWRP